MNVFGLIFLICFVSLLSFSGLAWRLSRKKEIGIWALGARLIPAFCAFMPIAVFVGLFFWGYFIYPFTKECILLSRIGILFLAVFPIVAGFAIFLFFARKMSGFWLSLFVFASYFSVCAVYSFGVVCVNGFLLQRNIIPFSFTWHCAEIPSKPVCFIEFKRTHFTSEYDRRVKFASGKTVGIEVDTGGAGGFFVDEILEGKILLTAEKTNSGFKQYIIDSKKETIHAIFDGKAYLLKGDLISGCSSVMGSKRLTIFTYKKNLDEQDSYDVNAESLQNITQRKYLGKVSAGGFEK